MIEKYIKHLTKNNYSVNTIRSYASILLNKNNNIDDLRTMRKFILSSKKRTTMHTRYNVIVSYLNWIKDKRVKALKELKLPPVERIYRHIVTKKYVMNKTEVMSPKEAFVRFLFETGIRASEFPTIFDINNKTLKVVGKGDKVREIIHNIETTKIITRLRISTKTMRIWVKDILGNEYSPHSLRRSHATHMLLKGANAKTVSLQLGHSKVETTYRYLQLSKKENIKIYNKYF